MTKKQSEFQNLPENTKKTSPDTSKWPILLHDFYDLTIKSTKYTPINSGSTPR